MAVPAQGPNGVYCRATLVVCPLVAVIQWRQEIARFTAPGALKVNLLGMSCVAGDLQAYCVAVHVRPLSLALQRNSYIPVSHQGQAGMYFTAPAGVQVKPPDRPIEN